MRRWLLSSLLSLLTISGVVYFLFSNYNFDFSAILKVAPGFLLLGLVVAFVDLSLRGARIVLVSRQAGCGISFWRAVRIVMSVDFFAAITPARVGGEGARIVGFLQSGMRPTQALLVAGFELMMDSGYLFVALPAFLFLTQGHESEMVQILRGVIVTLLIGFGIPTLLTIMHEKYLLGIVKFVQQRMPFVYRLISRNGKVDLGAIVKGFRDNVMQILRGPWWCFPLGVLLTCGWWTLRFGVLFWVSFALGFDISVGDVFWPQFLIYNSLIYAPMPASGGLFEAGFLFFYKNMIPSQLLPSAMLLWRSYTYYLYVLVGGVFTTKSMWRYVVEKVAREDEIEPGDGESNGSSQPEAHPRACARR